MLSEAKVVEIIGLHWPSGLPSLQAAPPRETQHRCHYHNSSRSTKQRDSGALRVWPSSVHGRERKSRVTRGAGNEEPLSPIMLHRRIASQTATANDRSSSGTGKTSVRRSARSTLRLLCWQPSGYVTDQSRKRTLPWIGANY